MPASKTPSETSKAPVSPVETLTGGSLLDVGDGHRVWWCEGGDPAGVPVLVIHGGPGGRSRVESIEGFAGLPVRWICIDQRGCGRSTPQGETRANTLAHLLDDIELLRAHLGWDRWSVAAGSWGAFVALAWAARCSDRLNGLFLRSPFLGSADELAHYLAPWPAWIGEAGRAWLGGTPGLEQLYQQASVPLSNAGTAFSPIPEGEPQGPSNAPDHGSDRLGVLAGMFDAAQSAPGGVSHPREIGPGPRAGGSLVGRTDSVQAEALRTAERQWSDEAGRHWRVHAHYARTGWTCGHDAWAWAVQVLSRVAGPVTLVHGVEDAVCPVQTMRRLAAWVPPASSNLLRVVEVPGGGHRMGQEPMRSALREAARAWALALGAVGIRRPASPGSAAAPSRG